jgi:hypothetical protein
MLRRSSLRREGQALPMLALTLLLLLGFSGLAIDGANAFTYRRLVMNATDGAVMVGTRQLVTEYKLDSSGDGTEVLDAIEEYLENELGADGVAFEAYYVDRLGQRLPVGGPTEIEAGPPPDDARGVSIDVRRTFPTYMIHLFGQPDLTVSALATARFGPIGTAIGADVVPFGMNQTAADTLRDNEGDTLIIDLYGERQAENVIRAETRALYGTTYPEDLEIDIRAFQLKSISFDPTNTDAPDVGGAGSCDAAAAAADQDTLGYWWCFGSQYQVRARDREVGVANLETSLQSFINTRIGETVLIPVYHYDDDYIIDYFMAIEIEGTESYNSLRATYVGTYVTAGGLSALMSGGRGGACDACAINLVRNDE